MNWSALNKKTRTAPKSKCDVFQADLEEFMLSDLKSKQIKKYSFMCAKWVYDQIMYVFFLAKHKQLWKCWRNRARKQNKYDIFK